MKLGVSNAEQEDEEGQGNEQGEDKGQAEVKRERKGERGGTIVCRFSSMLHFIDVANKAKATPPIQTRYK